METATKTIERDGVCYDLTAVKTDSKVVGFAPTIQFNKLSEMTDVFDDATVLSLAVRQYRTDAQNKVRAKTSKDKVTASDIFAEIKTGRFTSEMMTEANRMWQATPAEAKDFTEAAAKLLGLGKQAKPAADTIHWDIL